jgi:hypothetical protein
MLPTVVSILVVVGIGIAAWRTRAAGTTAPDTTAPPDPSTPTGPSSAPPPDPATLDAPLLHGWIATTAHDADALQARIVEQAELYAPDAPVTLPVELHRNDEGLLDVVFPAGVVPYTFANLVGWLEARDSRLELANGETAQLLPLGFPDDTVAGPTSAGREVQVHLPDAAFMQRRRSAEAPPPASPGTQLVVRFPLVCDASAFCAGTDWPDAASTTTTPVDDDPSSAVTVEDAAQALRAMVADPDELAAVDAAIEDARWRVVAAYDPVDLVAELLAETLAENAGVEVDDEAHQLVQALEHERRAAEATWESPTVNDRIRAAFADLHDQGILALENAGWNNHDGWVEVAEAREELGADWGEGATFFHEQDVERGVDGQGLMLVFGPFHPEQADDDALAARIGHAVVAALRAHDVPTTWSGDIRTRIRIEPFPWQNRRA